MGEVKWIKIVTDIFGNRKIKQIEAMPDADAILVIWFKLLCLAGNVNECGLVTLTKDIPYTDEMLSTEFHRPLNTVRLALKTFEHLGMIEIVDSILCVSNWEKYQNIEGMERAREISRKSSAKYREKRQALLGDVTVTSRDVTEEDIEREEDKERDIREDTPIGDTRPQKHKYGSYKNVLLTEDEYGRLEQDYPGKRDALVNRLSDQIELKGYKAKSHYLAIRKWVVNAVREDEIREAELKRREERLKGDNNDARRTPETGAEKPKYCTTTRV